MNTKNESSVKLLDSKLALWGFINTITESLPPVVFIGKVILPVIKCVSSLSFNGLLN